MLSVGKKPLVGTRSPPRKGTFGNTAKESGMRGKRGWVLGLVLTSSVTRGAWAQVPQTAVVQEKKAEVSETAAPVPSSPATPLEYQPVQPRFYGNADYLLWWVHRGPLPVAPLVTTGDQSNPNAGI